MGFWAYPANPIGQQRHLFDRTTDAESLETAQLRDLEVGVGDISVRIQEDVDLAMSFQAGDWVN
ncbi:MAG: hypothetical protein M5U05_16215 [Anaerolineales bacterium]|nr:hypothetical protein [Anaerolineales bacterium]